MIKSEIYHFSNIATLIVSLGLTTLLGIAGVAVANFYEGNIIVFLLFVNLGIPLTSIAFLSQWFGVTKKIIRAGVYARKIEAEIADDITIRKEGKSSPLSWETWLHTQTKSNLPRIITIDYFAVIAIFLSFELGGLTLGSFRVWSETSAQISQTIIFLSALFFILTFFIF